MIRYLYGTQLEDHRDLAEDMFRARAQHPCPTSGMGTTIDAQGWETDDLDAYDPLYVIVCDARGRHAGSLRLLPSVGATRLAQGPVALSMHRIWSPDVWEVSRVCLNRGGSPRTGPRLMLGLSEVGLGVGLRSCAAVMTPARLRACRGLGWAPVDHGVAGKIAVGRWTFGHATHDRLCAVARIDARRSRDWWEVTFGDLSRVPLPVAV